MMVVWIDQYSVNVGISISVLGFILLFSLFGYRRKYRRRRFSSSSSNGIRSELGRSSDAGERRLRTRPGADVIIVGAGVAGAALAHALAKDGWRVHVIERDLTEPDRISGELLQPGGYLKLIELGLEECVENIDAQRVIGHVIYKNGKHIKLSHSSKECHLDVAGRSFHNGLFVQRMREKAGCLPIVRLEQGTVTSLLEENGTVKGVKYKNKDGDELQAYAPLTIVCDGCFSNLRRCLCSPEVDVHSHFVGFVLENCKLPFANHGHIILANPSVILFFPISSTEIRCLVDIPQGQKLPSIANGEMAKYLKDVVAPQVPPELYDGFIAAVERGNIRTMANRSMPAVTQRTPGALLMGDAFNMRHPLSGAGMTVALSDVVVLRDLLNPLQDLDDLPSLCKHLDSFYILRKPVAWTMNTLADVLYKVFCGSPDNEAHNEMREAFFGYLCLGGVFSNGPLALLSCLNTKPLSLVVHMFSVAVYAVARILLPFPSLERLSIGLRFLLGAVGIVFPIVKAEGVWQMLSLLLFQHMIGD